MNIKLKDLLNEVPVDTYQTIGNFDKAASFNDKRDRELVVHSVAIQKVKDFFKNSSADFDFYFVNLQGRRKFAELGKVKEDFIFEPYPEGLGITPEQLKDGKINHDNVTVFFVGNSAAEKVPMTAWTIAHRFGHVLRREYAFEVYEKWLENEFSEILKMYNIATPQSSNFYGRTSFDKSKAQLFNQIGTMRSARQNEITRPNEFYYELFAQYLKFGKVTFNKLNDTIVSGTGTFGRKNHAKTRQLDDVNQALASIERDFQYYAEDILSDAIGNVYVM